MMKNRCPRSSGVVNQSLRLGIVITFHCGSSGYEAVSGSTTFDDIKSLLIKMLFEINKFR